MASSVSKAKKATATSKTTKTTPTDHLPPFVLQSGVFLLSGILLVFCLRDFLTTGKNIAGVHDAAYLKFTKSTAWFDDSNGWKSQQGGFSAIATRTTDANNMGGFFVRKLAGAAGVGFTLCKLWPWLRMGNQNALSYSAGHFQLFLWTTVVADLMVLVFLGSYARVLQQEGAWELPGFWCAVLAMEVSLLLYCLVVTPPKKQYKAPDAIAMPKGKTPNSLPSNIVARTVAMVSTWIVIISLRDLFAPGRILSLWFYDDLYLEWTNAFFHSPPPGSPEALDHTHDVAMYTGDKFISQLAAVYLLCMTLYKVVGSMGVRFGADGSGTPIASLLFWQATAISNVLLLFLLRVFAGAAASASWNIKFHVMAMGYELFILGLYGFC